MTVLDTVKGLIAVHGANAVGAFTVADIATLVEYVEASEAWTFRPPIMDGGFYTTYRRERDKQWQRLKAARAKLGLAEKEAGRG